MTFMTNFRKAQPLDQSVALQEFLSIKDPLAGPDTESLDGGVDQIDADTMRQSIRGAMVDIMGALGIDYPNKDPKTFRTPERL